MGGGPGSPRNRPHLAPDTPSGGTGDGEDSGSCLFLRVQSRDPSNPRPTSGLGPLPTGEARGGQAALCLLTRGVRTARLPAVLPPSPAQQGRPRHTVLKRRNGSSEANSLRRRTGSPGSEDSREGGSRQRRAHSHHSRHTLTGGPLPGLGPTHPPSGRLQSRRAPCPQPCTPGRQSNEDGRQPSPA